MLQASANAVQMSYRRLNRTDSFSPLKPQGLPANLTKLVIGREKAAFAVVLLTEFPVSEKQGLKSSLPAVQQWDWFRMQAPEIRRSKFIDARNSPS